MKLNEEIRAKEVRVNSSTNEQLGVMPLKEALRLAMEQNMDLVEVAPTAKPPVCRIMDYGKFKYEQQKRDKEVKKKQRTVVVKEVKVRPNIEDHDYEVKFKNAVRFLEDGDKVKLTVMFRGREVSHPELGKKVLDRMAAQLKGMDMVIVEREAKLEGKNMIMILSPKVHN
ncbi:translation initiation factor IF-3 [Azotosporobacter soli]|uniref:translation initiation factor IF-3 n=1 Tax=Azotosporobacter soli TaxID=3055040 RepID=UPI0031FF03F6